ncbi:hypothetical protein FRB97_000878 [Tulasnella sp. 331]|nr:hypothetical protein FRB97_000878 [Tulasnella sp. 331]
MRLLKPQAFRILELAHSLMDLIIQPFNTNDDVWIMSHAGAYTFPLRSFETKVYLGPNAMRFLATQPSVTTLILSASPRTTSFLPFPATILPNLSRISVPMMMISMVIQGRPINAIRTDFYYGSDPTELAQAIEFSTASVTELSILMYFKAARLNISDELSDLVGIM